LIVWGYLKYSGWVQVHTAEGAAYNPKTGLWSKLPSLGIGGIRTRGAFLWTGTGLFNWGGFYRDTTMERDLYDGWYLAHP